MGIVNVENIDNNDGDYSCQIRALQSIQGMLIVIWPGTEIVMTPAQAQLSVLVSFSAGWLFTVTEDDPGAQGVTVFGTQGAGVKRTGGGLLVAGLVGLLHIPNGGIFTFGL